MISHILYFVSVLFLAIVGIIHTKQIKSLYREIEELQDKFDSLDCQIREHRNELDNLLLFQSNYKYVLEYLSLKEKAERERIERERKNKQNPDFYLKVKVDFNPKFNSKSKKHNGKK